MTADFSGLRLLVVEDEPMNRTLLRAVLQRSGDPDLRSALIREAETLAQARALLSSGPADVVILDVRLPDGSGLDLARELVSQGGFARPRILIMSASVLPEERTAAIEAGCDAFLGKPFRPHDLVETLGMLRDRGMPPRR